MRFEWDETKRRHNLAKHGIDFIRVWEAFDGRPIYSYASPRGAEERFVTLAPIEGRLVAVVWTKRGEDTVRIISARRARDAE